MAKIKAKAVKKNDQIAHHGGKKFVVTHVTDVGSKVHIYGPSVYLRLDPNTLIERY